MTATEQALNAPSNENMAMTKSCPTCQTSMQAFYSFSGVPTNSCILM